MKKTLFLLPLLAFILTACSPEEEVNIPSIPDPVVTVMELTQQPVYQISEIGTIKPLKEVEIIAQAAGKLDELVIEVGDAVSSGDLLAKIDTNGENTPAQINLETAQLQLNNAESSEDEVRANNQAMVAQVELRVKNLESTIERLQRNLQELQSQNATNQTGLSLQQDNVGLNVDTTQENYDALVAKLDQSLKGLFDSSKTALDGVYVTIESNFSQAENILNPAREAELDTTEVVDGLGENNLAQLYNLLDLYDRLRDEVKFMQLNYEDQLPLTESNFLMVLNRAESDLEAMRVFLAEFRTMLNHSVTTESLLQPALEGYRAAASGAEAAVLGELARMDTLRQNFETFELDRSNQLFLAQNNLKLAQNQLSESTNSASNFTTTSTGAVKDLEAQIRQTQNDLLAAQTELESARRNATLQNSAKDLEIDTLANQVDLAQNTLENNQIESTIDGVVSRLTVDEGDYVSPGTPIATIIQKQQVKIVFYLSEEYADLLTVGQAFTFTLSEQAEEIYEGNISKIAPTVDPVSRKVEVEGTVQNSELELKPEMLVNLTLDLSEQLFDATKIYVPINAVIFGQAENYVYVVEDHADFNPWELFERHFVAWLPEKQKINSWATFLPFEMNHEYRAQDHIAAYRKVETGGNLDGWMEIVDGLDLADLVIVDGQRNLPPEGGVTVDIAS